MSRPFETLSRLGIQVLPVPSIDHMEIARRAAKGIAPYSEKKDGYRDILIWFTLRSIANRDASNDVWYVSQNTQDFADPGSSGDFPSFHPGLLSELESGASPRSPSASQPSILSANPGLASGRVMVGTGCHRALGGPRPGMPLRRALPTGRRCPTRIRAAPATQ